jgi:thioredoxin reductase (NADPH)
MIETATVEAEMETGVSCNNNVASAGSDSLLDCIVIGAGPAGLTAATYLERFHRDIVVLDAGASRARWIPTTHNCPGFPFGVGGVQLLEKLRTQACTYGARIVEARVDRLERDGRGFVALAGERHWRARCVLVATGIVDAMPPIDDLEQAIDAGVVRLCAICDGYEASDERIAVYGALDSALRHALFLRTFSRHVSVVLSQPDEASAEDVERARQARVQLLPVASRLQREGDTCRISFAQHDEVVFDTVYPVLGEVVQSDLATALGAGAEDGALRVDATQQTSVDGLYAIGDVVLALNQISVAVGHAAVAATAIHNRLPANYRED